MKDNAALFDKGMTKATKLISQHLSKMLSGAADGLVADALERRIYSGHNMTGNTATSYAAGVYVNGSLQKVHRDGRMKPLQRKLTVGQRFSAGRERWDGDVQERTFTAGVQTDGDYGYSSVRDWLQGLIPIKDGFQICVMSGVEYALFQERECDIDVLTSTFMEAPAIIQSYIRPIE
jgi:hypothetical protein